MTKEDCHILSHCVTSLHFPNTYHENEDREGKGKMEQPSKPSLVSKAKVKRSGRMYAHQKLKQKQHCCFCAGILLFW